MMMLSRIVPLMEPRLALDVAAAATVEFIRISASLTEATSSQQLFAQWVSEIDTETRSLIQ